MRTGLSRKLTLENPYQAPPNPRASLIRLAAVVVRKPGTGAGLHLSRQYRVRPAIADLIAALAGLGSEGSA